VSPQSSDPDPEPPPAITEAQDFLNARLVEEEGIDGEVRSEEEWIVLVDDTNNGLK
jgi:hypothetical protein